MTDFWNFIQNSIIELSEALLNTTSVVNIIIGFNIYSFNVFEDYLLSKDDV